MSTRPFFFGDCESSLICPGLQAPPLISLQFAIDEGRPQIVHVRDPACRRTLEWALAQAHWSFHNLSFDAAVICAAFPDLTGQVFAAYDDNRMHCTIARQKLADIASGRFKVVSKSPGYALDAVARRLKVDLEIDKGSEWRLKYGTLYGVDIAQWPEEALRYALNDAVAQREIHKAQDAYAAQKGYSLQDEYRQSRKAFWTALMSVQGIMVDPARVDQYISDVREALDEDRVTCQAQGLVRDNGVKNTKEAMAHMVKICQETEEPDLPITESGEKVLREMLGLGDKGPIPVGASWELWEAHGKYVKLDEDSCQLYGDELLEAYQRYGTSTTQIARAMRLKLAAVRRVPIQSRFQSLGADTGRMTCSQGDKKKADEAPSALGFQLQNPAKNRKVKRQDGTVAIRKGTRELFVPRPGFYFCSTDYGSMELAGWAQVCIWTVGQSKLADVLNAGRDPHTELGATIARISTEEAYARRAGEQGPEAKQAFDSRERQLAKIANFGYMAAMGPAKMVLSARKQYGVPMTVAEAKALRGAWMQTWPEAARYFDWIKRQMANRGSGEQNARTVSIEQFKSGRVRGGCWYTQAANTLFQGFCADIFGEAMWRVSREMYTEPTSPLYGSRLVNALHDEGFSEVRIDRAHAAAHRQAQIQIDVGREWGPDVAWTCQPAIMTRWFKEAEPKYDAEGRLIPWA